MTTLGLQHRTTLTALKQSLVEANVAKGPEPIPKKAYQTTRNGRTQTVIVVEVKRNSVRICEEGREDSTWIPLARFTKFYVPA